MVIDNKKESAVSGAWSNPGASLYNQILNQDNYKTILKEAYLIAPVDKIYKGPHGERPSFSASGISYPHHVIRDGKLVIHEAGLRAAYSRAEQQGIVKGEVEAHLIRHYKEMGWYKESTISEMEQSEINNGKQLSDDYIAHFGILGMKWGVRRERGPDGLVTSKKISSEDYARSREIKKKKISEMTNAELKTLVDRMNLESQFKNLKSRDISSGRKIVTDILKETGKELAKEHLRSGYKTGIEILSNLLKKKSQIPLSEFLG